MCEGGVCEGGGCIHVLGGGENFGEKDYSHKRGAWGGEAGRREGERRLKGGGVD